MEAHVAPNQAVSSGHSAGALRIMLVWGVRFTAESLAEMLKRDALISIVGLCTNLSEAMALSEALQPEIILLDARIPDGITALRRGLDVAPGMRVGVSAVSQTEHDVIAWAEAGAIGYIPRTTSLGDFVRLVQTIHSGEQEAPAWSPPDCFGAPRLTPPEAGLGRPLLQESRNASARLVN